MKPSAAHSLVDVALLVFVLAINDDLVAGRNGKIFGRSVGELGSHGILGRQVGQERCESLAFEVDIGKYTLQECGVGFGRGD